MVSVQILLFGTICFPWLILEMVKPYCNLLNKVMSVCSIIKSGILFSEYLNKWTFFHIFHEVWGRKWNIKKPKFWLTLYGRSISGENFLKYNSEDRTNNVMRMENTCMYSINRTRPPVKSSNKANIVWKRRNNMFPWFTYKQHNQIKEQVKLEF